MLKTITWTGESVRLLDQTRLPTETAYLDITDERQMWDAIKRLVVRGAPAIGIAAAFGVYLGVRRCQASDFSAKLKQVCDYLAASRPTAVNLFWALDRMKRVAREALALVGSQQTSTSSVESSAVGSQSPSSAAHSPLPSALCLLPTADCPLPTADSLDTVRQRLLDECLAMIDEDTRVCRSIGEHGLELLLSLRRTADHIGILTHCNAGGLATAEYGTALAPIYVGAEQGLRFHVWSDETRPLLQGSRITAYELHANGIPVTVICDNMAATVMSQGKVQAVIVGTDRVAANGDVANKIGTHGVAILARHFGIPFYVAAPTSSIDLSIPTGQDIPIERRDPREISHGFAKQTAPDGVDIYNPAFDVTPAELVTAIITETGIITPPYAPSLRRARGDATAPSASATNATSAADVSSASGAS